MPDKILLVDDIYTTGKTLQLAKQILLEAGVKENFDIFNRKMRKNLQKRNESVIMIL